MAELGDAAGFGAVVVEDELIGKRNNPLSLENFVVQGMENKIFVYEKDNNDDNIFVKLYRELEKKKIIIKRYTFLNLYSGNFKFITSESLEKNLKGFTNEVDCKKLSDFLLKYEYRSIDQVKIFEKVKMFKKKGGEKTRKLRKKNKRNKTILHKRF